MKAPVRVLCLLLILLALPSAALAQDGGVRPGWRMITSRAPLDHLMINNFAGERPEGIVPIPVPGAPDRPTTQFDVREWLARVAGVALPTESIAIYDSSVASLVILAPASVIEELSPLLTLHARNAIDPQVRITATLAEFSAEHPTKARDLPYERLRSVAGKTWRELEEIVVTTKSGQRATGRRREGDVPREPRPPQDLPQWTPPLAPGEAGAALEVEPVIGPDGETVDLNVEWHRRLGQEEKAQQLETTTSMTIKDGSAIVAGRWPVDPRLSPNTIGPVRSYVLVVRVDLVNAEGVPLREAFAAAVRKLRE